LNVPSEAVDHPTAREVGLGRLILPEELD